jgi:outer membrane protein assembly factor BamB
VRRLARRIALPRLSLVLSCCLLALSTMLPTTGTLSMGLPSRATAAEQWTRFHGPNGTGASEVKSIPATWGEEDYNWKVALPGIGHSSPVIWEQKLFILSADPQTATRHMLCYDTETGNKLWQQDFESEPHHLHDRSSYASCTPAVDAERVYVAWSTPKQTLLLALDHAGHVEWQRDLGPWVSQHGFGTSPMLYKDLVILSNSQQANQLKEGQKPGDSYMMAFDRATGEERWRTPRKSVNVCYSVPCIYTPAGGKPELISTSTGNGMFSLDPDTGKENWTLDLFSMRTVSSPLLVGNILFGSTGSGGGGNYVVAVEAGNPPRELYRIKQSAPYVPTSVAYGDLVFLWYDKGVVSCIDAKTGEEHWRERVGGGFSGSAVRAGDKVYCINEDGEVIVVAASKEFKLLGRNPLGEPSRATPAISGGRMYLRTYSHLFSIGAKSL